MQLDAVSASPKVAASSYDVGYKRAGAASATTWKLRRKHLSKWKNVLGNKIA